MWHELCPFIVELKVCFLPPNIVKSCRGLPPKSRAQSKSKGFIKQKKEPQLCSHTTLIKKETDSSHFLFLL